MNAPATINAALASYGMEPADGYASCACCKDNRLWREEIATTESHQGDDLAKIETHYGGKVCKGCVDDQECCAECGEVTFDGECEPCADYGESEADFQRGEAWAAGHYGI